MTLNPFPFDRFILELPAECSSTLNTVDQHTHETSFGRSFNPLNKGFSGDVSDQGFKIRRAVEYQNSFSPIIIGTVTTNNEHCSLKIEMRMHYFVMAFMLIWLSGALALTFGAFSFSISGTNAFITFLIGYGLMMNSFWKEAKKAKNELDIIFKELY